MLRNASNRAKDGQFVIMQKVDCSSERGGHQVFWRHTLRKAVNEICISVHTSVQMDPKILHCEGWDISSREQSVRPLPARGNYPAPHFCIPCHSTGASPYLRKDGRRMLSGATESGLGEQDGSKQETKKKMSCREMLDAGRWEAGSYMLPCTFSLWLCEVNSWNDCCFKF